MAEEHGNPPVKLERIRRETVNPRRNSIGPSTLGRNYLRASTGSCHDFCKFGKVHSCEPKGRNPLRRKPIKKPTEDEILVKSAVFLERKKIPPVNRPRSSPDSQIPVRESPDVLGQKEHNSDRRNPVRGDLGAEKKMNPAATIKPSLKMSTLTPVGKKSMKMDLFSRNGTSKQSLSTSETSKQVQKTGETSKQVRKTGETSKQVRKTGETSKHVRKTGETSKQVRKTNETLTGALQKVKEMRLSGSVMAPLKSSSLSIRRLSSSDSSSLIRLQKRGEMKPQENTGIHKVVTKNLYVSSSASPPSKPFISKQVAVNNVPNTTVVKRKPLNGASPMKRKDEVKDVEVAISSNREETTGTTLYIVNMEESPDVEETESEISKPVDDESIDESIITNSEEMESKPLEVGAGECIMESTIVNVEEMESKPLEAAASEGVVEGTIMNVEETESKPLEAAISECIVESNIMNVGETESIALESLAREGVAESNIMNVKETESKLLEPVIGESISPRLPVPIAESSSLSPSGSPPPLEGEGQTESEYSVSEWEDYSASENEESDLIQGSEVSEEDEGKTQSRKGGPRRPGNEEGSKPWKLRFRRGRTIDVQHENDTPRRLRFRQRRVLGESQNLNPEFRRSGLKKRELIEGESNDDGTDDGSAKVVLRHSDVQEKKDAKGLFNNVIEETASKLAETRKSKVKALVGAFETVISLQDMKPSADT